MIQFYSPDIERNPVLGPEEAHHCVRVLRRRVGDDIYVTNGKGKRFLCEILEADSKEIKISIKAEEEVPKGWDCKIILAVAPTKNADRMSWLVEKATEIGVDEVRFLSCQNSERRHLNVERLRKNAISAMNQSLKTRLPEIKEICTLNTIFDIEGDKYFGYCDSNTERKEFVKEYKGGNVTVLIGPEGDFSKEEVESLRSNGFEAVTFGNERLRTETAALFGLVAVHILNQK